MKTIFARVAVAAALFAGLLGTFLSTAQAANPVRIDNAAQRFADGPTIGKGVRPFVAGSLAGILAQRQGRPFVLVFWSSSCGYCPAELKALSVIRKANPKLGVVLVSADTPEEAPLAAKLAAKYGLGKAEQWIFADEMEERLRFDIDPRWHGELPRTHFYDREHRTEVISGIVPQQKLLAWVKANVR